MLKRYLFILIYVIGSFNILCYGQEPDMSIERAMSLSNMADFYYTAHNYEKATEYAKKSIEIIKSRVLSEFKELDHSLRYELWQNVNSIFDSTYPSYVAKHQNDSTLTDLYNTVLFSKGITWRKVGSYINVCWKDIQNSLGQNDVVIEFISPVLPSNDNMVFYALTIKRENRSPKMIRLFDILQLGDTLRCCDTKTERDRKIGRMVWSPLEKELEGIKNVYFSATHVLNNMPIEYMPITETECYNDRYNMFRLSTTQEIAKHNKRKNYRKAVLFGGLQYEPVEYDIAYESKRGGYEPLPNTDEEVEEIAKLLGNNKVDCKLYKGTQGREPSFMSLSGDSINILHLATHGMYSPNSVEGGYHDGDKSLQNSVIVFAGANERPKSPIGYNADGIVTALDISQMIFGYLDLVTLSACESAMGEYGIDDSIMGLQRGFKIAGANTILMSLDKVDDEATKILMIEFYKNLMAGKSKHQSLKDAQRYLRQVENGRYDEPKYWASFIMLDGLD